MNLLLDDRPLVILPSLAKELGNLNEAVFLQQLHYWINIKQQEGSNFIENRYWVYNSLDDWLKQFIWMSKKTLQRTINSLISKGIVLKGNFNRTKMDQTCWYTIDYDRFSLLQDEAEKTRSEEIEKTLEEKKAAETLEKSRDGQNDHIEMDTHDFPCGQNGHIEMVKMTTSKRPDCPHRDGQNGHIQMAKMTTPIPYINHKINQETTSTETAITRASPRPDEVEDVLRAYNELCPSFPPASSMTPKREQAICALFTAGHDLSDIQRSFRRAEESDFLSGRSKDAEWDRFDFDWLIESSHFANVLEGKYDNISVRKRKRMVEGETLHERMLGKLRDGSTDIGGGAELSLPFFREAAERHRAFPDAGDEGSVQEAGP